VFLAAYFMQDPKNRAQSGVRVGLEVASSQAMHGGLWRAPFTAATSAFELAIVWYCVNEVRNATVRPSSALPHTISVWCAVRPSSHLAIRRDWACALCRFHAGGRGVGHGWLHPWQFVLYRMVHQPEGEGVGCWT